MKKRFALFMLVICIIGVSVAYISLSKDKYYDLKKDVWMQLSDQQKKTVLPEWKDAEVREVIQGGEKVLEVKFVAGKSSTLGDLIVYVNSDKNKIISIKKRA